MRVAVLTSFTSDYDLGWLCSPVNEHYAKKHGYAFLREVIDPNQQLRCKSAADSTSEVRHPTWNKVRLIHELLEGLLRSKDAPLPIPLDTTHLLWVDADAAVVRQSVLVEDLWRGLPATIELLIGEDVTSCCLVNAGVFCVRVSEWSLQLWRDVWASAASRKFHNKRYHEQSALLRQLERRGEGLDLVRLPFHSYCGGHAAPKLFPHVCVLPRSAFNTNRCDIRTEAAVNAARAPGEPETRDEDACNFIFHAAGHPFLRTIGEAGTAILWKPPKAVALVTVFQHFGLGELLPQTKQTHEDSSKLACEQQEAEPRAWGVRHRGQIAN